MGNNLLVSVIIATYKRLDSLQNAITSVEKQMYINIEIIIVNDNANELYSMKVKEIIESSRGEYPIIYIENEVNKGSAETRNIGIRNASGKYITFLDDDDMYLPDKVSTQIDYMINNNLDLCFTDLALYNKDNKLVDYRSREFLKSMDNDYLLKQHLMKHITGTDTFMIKRDLLNRINNFDCVDIADEYYLMYKAIQSGAKIGYLQGCKVIAYVHETEGGLSTGSKKIEGENDLFDFKKKHFLLLKNSEQRYIKCRHYMVLAYVYANNRKFIESFTNAVRALLFSPRGVFSEVFKLIKLKFLNKTLIYKE